MFGLILENSLYFLESGNQELPTLLKTQRFLLDPRHLHFDKSAAVFIKIFGNLKELSVVIRFLVNI